MLEIIATEVMIGGVGFNTAERSGSIENMDFVLRGVGVDDFLHWVCGKESCEES